MQIKKSENLWVDNTLEYPACIGFFGLEQVRRPSVEHMNSINEIILNKTEI